MIECYESKSIDMQVSICVATSAKSGTINIWGILGHTFVQNMELLRHHMTVAQLNRRMPNCTTVLQTASDLFELEI